MPFVTTALAVGGIAAGLGGSALAAHSAGKAAQTQADAAKSAAQLQAEQAQKSLDFQKQQWETQQQNEAPWLNAGKAGLSNLQQLLGVGKDDGTGGYGDLSKGWTGKFQAPTDVTEANDPGYKFRISQGQDAISNSAAARGGLLSGNTAKAIDDYTQQSASQEYGNVYNRAFGQYQQQYNEFQQGQANRYNRLASLAGVGQTAAQTLGQEGQAASGNVGNILMTSGAQQGADLQNAAAARASGYVGSANAWNSGLSGAGNNLTDLLLLQQLKQQQQPTGTLPDTSAA